MNKIKIALIYKSDNPFQLGIHNDPKWEKIASKGREYTLKNLNNDKAVESLVELMQSLL